MDLAINFIILIIFGIFGFIVSKIIGINPYRIFTDLTAGITILIMIIIIAPATLDPENALNTIPNFLEYFVSVLPGIVIGDAAGSVISAITD